MINVLTCNNNLFSYGRTQKLRCVLKFVKFIYSYQNEKKALESDMPHLKFDP